MGSWRVSIQICGCSGPQNMQFLSCFTRNYALWTGSGQASFHRGLFFSYGLKGTFLKDTCFLDRIRAGVVWGCPAAIT